jgi:hypothetical protein
MVCEPKAFLTLPRSLPKPRGGLLETSLHQVFLSEAERAFCYRTSYVLDGSLYDAKACCSCHQPGCPKMLTVVFLLGLPGYQWPSASEHPYKDGYLVLCAAAMNAQESLQLTTLVLTRAAQLRSQHQIHA